ncbi:MAG: HD domain-containing protein, partial [Alphaproteobacteria bacterium]|nr:HD domain-containing protein [Alphaproteobacteria bacterium]
MSTPGLRQELLEIFVGRATKRYGLSGVNQLQHALQAAHLAEQEEAGDALVAAALLHDIGHYLGEFGEDYIEQGVDDLHEEAGARVLEGLFPPLVVA